MLLPKEALENTPVVSLQTGMRLAVISSIIIDPRELKVIGFYCDGPRLDVNPAILLIADIREIGDLGIIVDSADVLAAPEDLVRLKDVLGYNFSLDQKQVIDESEHKIGKVTKYVLDSNSLFIVKLLVQPAGLLQSLKTTELSIDRSQVVQVNDHQVIVKSTAKKAKEAAAPERVVLQNPFRRAPAEGASSSHADR